MSYIMLLYSILKLIAVVTIVPLWIIGCSLNDYPPYYDEDSHFDFR
jgi:hypothetical protein